MGSECCVCHASFDVVCDVSAYGMLVCVSLSINVFTVLNTLLMSNATAIVRVGGMGWLKPVATVLEMLCSAVLVECLVLNPCCVVMSVGVAYLAYWYVLFACLE